MYSLVDFNEELCLTLGMTHNYYYILGNLNEKNVVNTAKSFVNDYLSNIAD